MGFEPTRAEHIGLAVQRLNHSATSSTLKVCHKWKECMISERYRKAMAIERWMSYKRISHAGN